MKRRRKIIIPTVTAALLLCAVGIFVFMEIRLSSVRDELSTLEANSTASSALTAGLERALDDYKLNYSDVVSFTYDENGNIKSLSADIITLNTLGNEIGTNTDAYVNEIGTYEIVLPLSSLLGIQLLSGIGPDISFFVTMRGLTSTCFENKFESAGVNQTRHQIFLNVTIRTHVIFGGDVNIVEYNSEICIAESIIVGVTPNTFADLNVD
ncbi:MAG: sporulation protein YunB [Clostridia bacterium]|nr:sporulation protein YunB [Clostridia bacterium]